MSTETEPTTSPNRGTGAASAMFFYAALLVGGGVTAFAMAPVGVDARTALLVPFACAASMMISAMLALQVGRVKVLGMIGIHVGLVLPLVFAAAIGFRAVKTGAAIDSWKTAERAYATSLEKREIDNGAAARVAFFEEQGAPTHDKSYARNALWFLTIASVVSFGLILSNRPKPEDRGA